MFRSNRLLFLIFTVFALVVGGAVTSKQVREAKAFLHEGIRVTARVVGVRYTGGKSAQAMVELVYPTLGRSMVVFDAFSISQGRGMEAAGSVPAWYLPREPAVHRLELPTQETVRRLSFLRIAVLGGIVAFAGIGILVGRHNSQVEAADLRYGTAYVGRVTATGLKVEYTYGPNGQKGKFGTSSQAEGERLWPLGKEMIVLQREGHRPRLWESIQAVQIDPKGLSRPLSRGEA